MEDEWADLGVAVVAEYSVCYLSDKAQGEQGGQRCRM